LASFSRTPPSRLRASPVSALPLPKRQQFSELWLRRTNVWRRVTSAARAAKRLRSGTTNGQRYDAPASQIDRATSRADPAQGALWRLSRELPRWKRDDGLLHG